MIGRIRDLADADSSIWVWMRALGEGVWHIDGYASMGHGDLAGDEASWIRELCIPIWRYRVAQRGMQKMLELRNCSRTVLRV